MGMRATTTTTPPTAPTTSGSRRTRGRATSTRRNQAASVYRTAPVELRVLEAVALRGQVDVEAVEPHAQPREEAVEAYAATAALFRTDRSRRNRLQAALRLPRAVIELKSGVPENADSTDVRLRATTRQKQGWMWVPDAPQKILYRPWERA